MATTTNGLPYPVGTDRVMDGDDAIKALAEALDPPWTALTMQSGFSAQAGTPGFRVIAGTCYLRGHVQRTTGNLAAGDIPCNVPAAGRPIASSVSMPAAIAGTGTGRVDVSTAGVLSVQVGGTTPSWLSLDGVSYALRMA